MCTGSGLSASVNFNSLYYWSELLIIFKLLLKVHSMDNPKGLVSFECIQLTDAVFIITDTTSDVRTAY